MAEENSGFPNGASAEKFMEFIVPVLNDLPDTTPLAHLDAERGVFITSKGNEIALSGQPISSLMLERITNEGKPKIPMVEVTILGKHKQMQANANDPGYLALLEEWKGDQNVKVLRYVFVVGAKGQPPSEFIDTQRQFFPNATDADLKYLWVSSQLPDEDIDSFSNVVIGKTLTTAKGLEEAQNFSISKSTGSE